MLKKLALASLLLTLLPLSAYARDYHVEAIIFSNPIPADAVNQPWDEGAPRNIRALNRLNTLFTRAEVQREAREKAPLALPVEGQNQALIPRVSFKLEDLYAVWEKLQQSPDYEVLQTLSWDQSEASYQASPLIDMRTPKLKGVIRVYAPNLLFAELNLLYAPDGLPEEPGEIPALSTDSLPQASASITWSGDSAVQETAAERYVLEEKRKLKLNEVHYFDQARFGVILMVKPIEEKPSSPQG